MSVSPPPASDTKAVALASSRLEAGLAKENRFLMQLDGYHRTGGVYRAKGAPIWIRFEAHEEGMERLIEIDRDTALPDQTWLLPHGLVEQHQRRAVDRKIPRSEPDRHPTGPDCCRALSGSRRRGRRRGCTARESQNCAPRSVPRDVRSASPRPRGRPPLVFR